MSGGDGATRRGMRLWELIALAAGAVLGSGWLQAPAQIGKLGMQSLLTWAVGALLMTGYAVVVVELGIADPRTGGLIFHPLRACGPLVATVVAGALWVAYAINPATQSLSVVSTLSGLTGSGSSPLADEEVALGKLWPLLAWATLLMAGVFLLNLLPLQRLLAITIGLTATKVLLVVIVIVMAMAVAQYDGADTFVKLFTEPPPEDGWPTGPRNEDSWSTDLRSVVLGLISAGVVFSYIGFQAPVDFAGDVQGDRKRVARTIRLAVYGTIAGSFLLYMFMQLVWFRLGGKPTETFVDAARDTGLYWPVLIAAIIAPLGSAIVFSLALTREVAALSRAHLVDRRLQSARFSRIWSVGRYDVYWLIALVNLGVAFIVAALAVGVGLWMDSSVTESLRGLNTVSILLVYTMSGVALAIHQVRLPQKLIAGAIFALTGVIVVATAVYGDLAKRIVGGVVVMVVAALILLGAPWLAQRDLPVMGRVLGRLDARNNLSRLGAWFSDASVPPFVWLTVYLVLLVGCVVLGSIDGRSWAPAALGLVLVGSLATFVQLVRFSRRYFEAPDRSSEEATVATDEEEDTRLRSRTS